MKKIVYSLLIIISSFMFITNVSASSFKTVISGNDTFENEITLYVVVNNLDGFTGNCNGLCGFVGTLSYNTEKIELTKINALQGFDLTQGAKIVLYKTSGVANGTKILELTFKNKSLNNEESTVISFNDIVGSDGDNDISSANTSKTIKYIVKTIAPETSTESSDNTTTKPNTTTANNKTNNKTNTTDKKSNNNNLKSLKLSTGNIDFKSNILSYDVVVSYDTTSISINGDLEDTKATVSGLGTHNLQVGNNKIEIVVKSESGEEKTYTINVIREEQQVQNNVVSDKKENPKKEFNTWPIIIGGIFVIVVAIIGYVVYKKNEDK